jgi:hypothetical protein
MTATLRVGIGGVLAALLCGALAGGAWAQPAMPQPPKKAWIYLAEPKNGATVKSPVKVVMKVVNMEVMPAGEVKAGTGHHHLVINTVPPPFGVAVPADAQNLHYGKGQTEATLELPPGLHTITAQFADGLHRSYGPQVSQTIIIKVE